MDAWCSGLRQSTIYDGLNICNINQNTYKTDERLGGVWQVLVSTVNVTGVGVNLLVLKAANRKA